MLKSLILMLFVFVLSQCMLAQGNTRLDSIVTLDFKSETLKSCIQKLEKNCHLYFSYNNEDLALEKKTISLSFNQKPLSFILETIFKNTSLTYKKIGGQIVVFKKKKDCYHQRFCKR